MTAKMQSLRDRQEREAKQVAEATKGKLIRLTLRQANTIAVMKNARPPKAKRGLAQLTASASQDIYQHQDEQEIPSKTIMKYTRHQITHVLKRQKRQQG